MTVKAEDRPSGLAGDSASVITFLFRLQPGLVEWRVLVAAARSGAALVQRQAHAPSSNLLNTPKEEEIMHRLSCVKSNFLFEMANVGTCFSL